MLKVQGFVIIKSGTKVCSGTFLRLSFTKNQGGKNCVVIRVCGMPGKEVDYEKGQKESIFRDIDC